MDISIPIIIAALPIFIGSAVGGVNAVQNFAARIGTTEYKLYMLIGAALFMLVTSSLWQIAFWLRRERMTGTLESLYLAPAHRLTVLGGVSFYANLRGLLGLIISIILGSLIFGINPFQGHILIAVAFIVSGLIPLWGTSFFFGSLILKIKEGGTLINLLQWIISFLMGIFYPVTVFPVFLQYIALSFPPTWMNQGTRAGLLNLSYFLGSWYMDLAVLWGFALIMPFLGLSVFRWMENHLRANEGVGQF
jgi:ABC-2 type transport system permease protein